MPSAKSPATVISDLLSTQGLGSTNAATVPPNWRIFTGRQADQPAQSITIFDLPGSADNPVFRIDYPAFQVRVRGARDDYSGAYAKMKDVMEFLNGIDPFDDSATGARWDGIYSNTGISFLQYDATSRPEFVATFHCFVEPAADSSSHQHRDSL
jgi:hypothetical protein